MWEFLSHLVIGVNATLILLSNLSLVYGFDHMPTFIRLVFTGKGGLCLSPTLLILIPFYSAWKVYAILLLCCYSLSPMIDEIRKLESTCPVSHSTTAHTKHSKAS